MAILKILKEPDERLRALSCEVPLGTDLNRLLDDMVDTLVDSQGVGLAAPQVGVTQRVLVMKVNEVLYKIINPKLEWVSVERKSYEEGCLSIPGHYDTLTRPARVKVRYFNEQWQPQERDFSGLEAVCVQHEMDHLDGVLFVDHLSWLKKSLFQKKRQRVVHS